MAWTPTSVAYGVRHNRLFGFLGRAGDAIDAVVPLQGTGNVPRKCFTRIGWPDQVTAMIVDDDEHYRLTFNIEGIILTINIKDVQMTQANARDMFIEVVNAALPMTNPDRRVNRIGIVESYDLPRVDPGAIAATALTRLADLGQPIDFSFRAVFRRSPPTGSDPGDWWNTILQVGAVKGNEERESPDILRVSIDCQHYFVPDRLFSPKIVRDHYARFYEEAEALQQNQLAGLDVGEPVLSPRNG